MYQYVYLSVFEKDDEGQMDLNNLVKFLPLVLGKSHLIRNLLRHTLN